MPAMRHDTVRTPSLRALRLRSLLTQSELSKRSDVSAFTILRAENGKPVSFSSVKKLAFALGTNPEILTNHDEITGIGPERRPRPC